MSPVTGQLVEDTVLHLGYLRNECSRSAAEGGSVSAAPTSRRLLRHIQEDRRQSRPPALRTPPETSRHRLPITASDAHQLTDQRCTSPDEAHRLLRCPVMNVCTSSSRRLRRRNGCGRRWRAVLAPAARHEREHRTTGCGSRAGGAHAHDSTATNRWLRRGPPTDPTLDHLPAGARFQRRYASLRDGLRPPLTPRASGQGGSLSVRGNPVAVAEHRAHRAHPGLRLRRTRCTGIESTGRRRTRWGTACNEDVAGSTPVTGSGVKSLVSALLSVVEVRAGASLGNHPVPAFTGDRGARHGRWLRGRAATGAGG